MIMQLAMEALLIQVLEPLSRKWSPLSSAVVLAAITSEPALGSVMPKPPMYSAVTSFSTYLALASSLP